MRRLLYGITAAGVLAVLAVSGCGNRAEPPHAGDVVTPKLSSPLKWTAGQKGAISVRLEAAANGSAPRALDFNGIPSNVNPVATVTFQDASGKELAPQRVELSHRC